MTSTFTATDSLVRFYSKHLIATILGLILAGCSTPEQSRTSFQELLDAETTAKVARKELSLAQNNQKESIRARLSAEHALSNEKQNVDRKAKDDESAQKILDAAKRAADEALFIAQQTHLELELGKDNLARIENETPETWIPLTPAGLKSRLAELKRNLAKIDNQNVAAQNEKRLADNDLTIAIARKESTKSALKEAEDKQAKAQLIYEQACAEHDRATLQVAAVTQANTSAQRDLDNKVNKADNVGILRRPRINSIGRQSILTFKNTPGEAPRELIIPIEGNCLQEEDGTLNLVVQISGTVPASSPNDYDILPALTNDSKMQSKAHGDIIQIRLKPSYVAQLKTNDRLQVVVAIHRPELGILHQIPGVSPAHAMAADAFAHREFTLYEVEDYRKKVIPIRIPSHDIQAFPLPEEEASILFGPLITSNYFVVRVSLRNTSNEEKLVNSGLISATGRAIVEPIDKTQPSFTVPVTISPQGPVQVYTTLDDEEADQPRARNFRKLEFIGALGTAAVTSFSGTPVDLSKGVSIFTGVAMPEARKLVPDRWPGYKRNVVTFAMPELTKVAKGATTTPKYLFFPKKNLELLVSDQALFESTSYGILNPLIKGRLVRTPIRPSVRVVTIGFDSMDIPFDQIQTPTPITSLERVGRILDQYDHHIEQLSLWKNHWDSAVDHAIGSPPARFAAVADIATIGAPTNLPKGKLIDEQHEQLRLAIIDLTLLANDLRKFAFPSATNAAQSELYKSILTSVGESSFSLITLKGEKDSLHALPRSVLAYSEAVPFIELMDRVEKDIRSSNEALNFTELAVKRLSSPNFKLAVESVFKDTITDPEREAAAKVIVDTYRELKNSRTVPILPEFDSAGLAQRQNI